MDAALNVKFGADTTALITGINKVEVTLAGLQSRLKDLQNQRLNIVDPVQLGVINRQIDGITGQIAKFKAVGTEAFDAVSKKVDGVVESSNNLVKGVNDGYSAIRKLAYILPGIGIAGIFNLAFDAIKSLIGGTEELNEALSKIKSNQGVLSEALGGSAGDIAKVQALAAAVQDTNLSYKERENALNRLKEINKSYFGDLSLEQSSLKILAQRVQEYSNALIQEAIVKGFTEEITKQTIEYNKQSDALKILKNNLDNAIKAQQAFTPVIVQAGGRGGGTGTAQAALEQNKLAASVNLARDAFDKQRNVVESIGTAIAGYTDKVQTAITEQLKLKPLKELDSSDTNVQNENLQYLEKTKKLIEDISKANNQPLFKLFQNVDQSGIGKEIAGSVEGGLAKINYDIYTSELAKATKLAASGAISPETFKAYSDALTDAFNKSKEPNLKVKLSFELEGSSDKSEGDTDPGKAIEKGFKKVNPNGFIHFAVIGGIDQKQFADTKSKLEKLGEDLGRALKEGLTNALVGVGDVIGQALATGGNVGKAAAQELLTIIGDTLQNLGKALIAFGIAKKIALDALKSLDPYVAIVAGIAAVAAGAVVKAAASPHAFAEGGIVTGPTVGLIGEAGPEVIFPLNKLNNFIKGNTQNNRLEVVGQTIISGPNLITVLKRAQTNQGMV